MNGIGQPGFVRVAEAARHLCISKSKMYQMIDAGEIQHARFGGAVRIPVDALKDYAARCTVGAN